MLFVVLTLRGLLNSCKSFLYNLLDLLYQINFILGFTQLFLHSPDTVVFYIHEKTSNFSQNWVLPIVWLFLLGMIGVISKNFNLSTLSKNIYFLLPTSILVFLLPLIYGKYEKIKKFAIHWYLFVPIIALYFAFSKDKLDDIAVMINPSKIFTSTATSVSGEFMYLLYKIAILFLVYQVIIAMKKKVRSK